MIEDFFGHDKSWFYWFFLQKIFLIFTQKNNLVNEIHTLFFSFCHFCSCFFFKNEKKNSIFPRNTKSSKSSLFLHSSFFSAFHCYSLHTGSPEKKTKSQSKGIQKKFTLGLLLSLFVASAVSSRALPLVISFS